MSKITKIMILLGLCLMCVGLLTSSFNLKALTRPFYNSDSYTKKEYNISEADITKLIIESANEKIKVIPTNDNNIKITYYENNLSKYEITSSGTEHKLKKDFRVKFMMFNFNAFEPDLVIEVPESLIINYNLKTSNSRIELDGLDINDGQFKTSNGSVVISNVTALTDFRITTSNSKIRLSNVKGNDLVLKTSNDDIILNDVTASTIDAKTSNSTISLNTVIARQTIFKTSNDIIKFRDLSAETIDLKTSNGRIEGNIIGNAEDYDRKINTSWGEITIDGGTYGKSYNKSGNSNYSITAKTSNDDIDIDFIK